MRPVVFDTDIGTDVDDILALVFLAKAPELKLLGVTTVYGDTNFRAKIAKATTQMLGRNDIKVIPGESLPVSGRQVHWAGHEGEGIPNIDAIEIKHGQSGTSYIGETAEALNGELEVIATGPLTNIARAITEAPASCAKIKHLYVMGGAFWMPRAEHNVKCDADAARVVFASGIPTTVISLDLTLRVWLGCCYDNAAMEAFFSTLKIECVYRSCFATHRSAQREIFCFMASFYNRRRRHSALGYLTPAEFENLAN
jgi:purine nucleosidase